MDIKKLAPWNWFKNENGDDGHAVPVKYNKDNESDTWPSHSLSVFNNDVDRLFGNFFRDFGLSPSSPRSRMLEGISGTLMKPRLDLGATDKEYTISVEIPGVSGEDVNLELVHDTLIIRGEKKQEKEEKKKNFYRLERTYGAFQRTLSLPDDADRDKIKADFRNGVLNIIISRMEIPGKESRQIEINYV